MSELNTFSEISNPTRLKILESKDCKISELAKKMDTTIQLLQRHVDRLFNSVLMFQIFMNIYLI